MDKIRASVGILTYNSGVTLTLTLESVKDFDDIIVCDGGSTDDTLGIAKRYGAHIIAQDAQYKNADGSLKDYSGVRNQCLAAARYDWFLYIDSDETASTALVEDVRRIAIVAESPDAPLVYRIPQIMIMDGITIRYSSIYPAYQHRFFNKKSGAYFGKPVHEKIYFDRAHTKISTLKSPWHTYRSRDEWTHYFSRLRKYRDKEVLAASHQSFARYLRWTLVGGLKTALGTLVRATIIYLLHGFRETIPVRGELGRVLSPLAIVGRLTLNQFGLLGRLCGKALRAARPSLTIPHRRPGDPLEIKIYYVANNRLPTERAHGIQIIKMCEAFAHAGVEVVLLAPARSDVVGDVYSAYGVERNFAIEYLPILNIPLWIPGAFALRTLLFARSVRARLAHAPAGIVYMRGEMPLFLTSLPSRFRLVWETHIKPAYPRRYHRAVERAHALVVVTKYYAAEIPKLWGIAADRVYTAPDGVSLEQFATVPSKEEARKKLDLPLNKKIVLYAGSGGSWKGVGLLEGASKEFGPEVLTVFVGDIKGMSCPQARYAGIQPYITMPLWLAAADVLILLGDPASTTAHHYTSPLKLFEYMASSRPIVALDLPSTREILDESVAYIVPATRQGLIEGINDALGNKADAEARAKRAREAVESFAWDTRAKSILAKISQERVALVLNPYDEAKPSGLGRAVRAMAEAFEQAAPDTTILRFTKKSVGGGALWLERLGKQPRADIYIFFTPVLPLLWRPAKSIVFVHDLGYFPNGGWRAWLLDKRHGRALRQATHIVAVSYATKERVVAHYGIAPEKISVIYNGTNDVAALPPEPVHDLPTDFFLYVGVVKPRKNVLTLVRAFKEYRAQGGQAALVIAGKADGVYGRQVEAEAKELGTTVCFLGYISDNQLAYLFSRATAFTYPSLVEGFGMTVVEAMAAGVPVITSNDGALAEITGDAALLVDPRSEHDIAGAMLRVADDEALRSDLAARGRSRAAEFSWDRAGAELLSTIKNVL